MITVPDFMTNPPAVAPLPALHAPQVSRFTLANGLQVLAIRRGVAPIVSLDLVVRAGADADPPELAGLTSAVAEMMDEGAGDRPALELAEAIEQLGGELWLWSGRDGSQLSVQVPTAGLGAMLDIVADVLIRPRLTDEDWARVKHDRLTSLAQRRDQPEAVASIVGDRVLFGDGHPYGRPVDGTETTVGRIEADHVRRHIGSIWRPNHAVLVVAGAFEERELRAEVERAIGSWQPGTVAEVAAPPGPARAPRLVVVDRPGAPQSIVRVSAPGEARGSARRPALSLLNAIFGGSFTSRLNFNLREQKGYTYGAGSSFSFLRWPGAFTARSSVFTEVTGPAVTEFLAEMRGMAERPPSPEEITKAQATLLGRVAEALSTAGGAAAQYADIGLYGLPLDEPERFLAAIEHVSAADLEQLARKYMDPDRAALVVVGDRAVIEPGLRAAGLPAPELRATDGALL